MADMQELIARLEAAEVGSRELDMQICLAANYVCRAAQNPVNICRVVGEPNWLDYEDGGVDCTDAVAELTTSLDAALALAERVLPEQAIGGRPGRLHDFAQHFNGRWEAKTYRVSDGSSHQSVAATPALALCIAILKAKAQGG